jgi:hypothetical protein
MKFMCYNCGCHIPDDNMGNPDNITTSTFKHLAEHWGKSEADVKLAVYNYLIGNSTSLSDHDKEHIAEMFDKASKAWGQPLDEAKKNATSMLKGELKF